MILGLVTIAILSIILNIIFIIKFNKLKSKNKIIESNKNAALEYIDALWKNQKDLIQDEKQASLNNLVSRIAHELNTPLGVALTAVTYIEDRVECNDVSPMVSLTKSNLDKSIALVEKFTEISGGNFNTKFTKINVVNFLDYTINLVKSNLEDESDFIIEKEISEDLFMKGSEVSLSLIIKNVLENAIHFSRDSYSKKVTIKAFPDNKDIKIIIKDSGCGISKDELSKIYEPFYTTRRSQRHHGLGLSISISLLNRYYKGYMACNSSRSNGTEFTITLPKAVCTQELVEIFN